MMSVYHGGALPLEGEKAVEFKSEDLILLGLRLVAAR